MKLKEKSEFSYEEPSNNILSKINLVNKITLAGINKLNEKYRELNLFIKQVRVDKYGNEKSKDDLIVKNYVSKKRLLKRHSKMTLEELYFKYYCYDSFSAKSKYLRSSSKIKDPESLCDKDDLMEIKQNLEEIHQDYQKLELKKCRIKTIEFKKAIIKYIQKYNKYLTENQYTELYNEMKAKAQLYIEALKVDDLSLWPMPLLKEFKAEIGILAIKNIFNKKLGINIDEEDKKNIKKEEKKKIEEESECDNSYSSFSES